MTKGEEEAEKRIREAREQFLTELDLSEWELETVPESLRQIVHLRRLNLRGNKLTTLPEWIGDFRSLEWLHLNRNKIKSLPHVITRLKRLTTLFLWGNPFKSIPDWISELNELAYLDLEDCDLGSLPAALQQMPQLKQLLVARNSRLGIPQEIVDTQNPTIILDYYFRTRWGQSRPLNEAKVILVGRGAVGKTSVVDRLVNDNFQPQKKTEGIQITHWPVQLNDSENVLLNIWDFGGQEIMHSTHQFFLTERSLYLVVLDGRLGNEDAEVEYWLKLIESFGGDSPVIVVLNKIRSHPFDLNRRGLREKYPRVRDFIRTDCDPPEGIPDLKQAILRETDRLPHLRDNFPSSWFSIKNRLSGMRDNFVRFDRYREICSGLGESDQRAQESLAAALHCLGIALNFKDDSRLRDTHVLNPHWVTTGIYRMLNSEVTQDNDGVLRMDDLRDILDSQAYPVEMHEFLLGLMRKFELCFRFPEPRDQEFLVPQLLGKEQLPLGPEFDPAACLNFQYTYPILPEGLLPRFIVRTHALSTHQPRWRTGVLLEFEGNRALVKADPQDRKVMISVMGPVEGRRRLLAVIRSDFERIHADIPKLNPVASVPLPGHPSESIGYDELRVFENSGVPNFHRAVGGKLIEINVGSLLGSVDLKVERTGRPVKVFVSYSHKDEESRAELGTQLKILQRRGLIELWHDRMIAPGDQWKGEIDRNLEEADLILLLVSADFVASDYCYEIEMTRALAGRGRVIPIVVRDCPWQALPFGKLQALPRDGTPVRSRRNRDAAWSQVAKGIEDILGELNP